MAKVLFFEVGQPPRLGDMETTLEALQAYVGGYIEAVTVTPDAALICNEEGRLLNLPYNRKIFGEDIYGPALIMGVKGEELVGLTDEQAAALMRMR